MTREEQLLTAVSSLTEEKEIAQKYVDHLSELFDVIDSSKIGTEFVTAIQKEDYTSAIAILADYYRKKPNFTVPELSANGSYNAVAADRAIEGYAREVNIDWYFPNGEIDFLFDPTALKGPRNHEWLWQFNRHGAWGQMARTYFATKDEKYVAGFKKQLLKWIAQTYVPEKWNGPGSAWRTIECGIRLLGTWPIAYDGFKNALDDVTHLLMIASMHRQVMHLVEHYTQRNWLMMEMNGVYTIASLFTELKDSEANRKLASELLLKELEGQILPDGMHNELSPDYHSVVLNCVYNFCRVAKALGNDNELPEGFYTLIRKTVNTAVLLSTPGFTQPRTNDTYTIKTRVYTERAEKLLGKEAEFLFVNSNRAEGTPPSGKTASAFLPYAGFIAMRSDWGADATYMCFDVGPLGAAHIHQDKLNINIYKGNEELIFDDGGGQYEISRARDYAISAYDHNTVLVDGMAQSRKEPREITEPIDAGWITNNVFDYATAVYDDSFGATKPATHKREVRFCKPDFFVVSDTLTSIDGNNHDYEILFHLDTTSVKPIPEYNNAIISEFGRKYEIAIIPLDDISADVKVKTASAVTDPTYRGWYNGRNENNLHPAITVSREVKGVENFKFNTLLFPVDRGAELPKVEKTTDGNIKVNFNGKETIIDLNSLNK